MSVTNTDTIEFFQNGGADETLDQAKADYEKSHPGRKAMHARFSYAYPGRPGEGRWVGIEIDYHEESNGEQSGQGVGQGDR
jgi:hypothetical protein